MRELVGVEKICFYIQIKENQNRTNLELKGASISTNMNTKICKCLLFSNGGWKGFRYQFSNYVETQNVEAMMIMIFVLDLMTAPIRSTDCMILMEITVIETIWAATIIPLWE